MRRFLRKLPRALNPTVPLDFGPGESAQVDFGAGPTLVEGGRRIKTWVFVMVLSFSRLLYAWINFHKQSMGDFSHRSAKIDHFLLDFWISGESPTGC